MDSASSHSIASKLIPSKDDAAMTQLQLNARTHVAAVAAVRHAQLLGDRSSFITAHAALKAAEELPGVTTRMKEIARRLIRHTQDISKAGFPKMILRLGQNDGSMCTLDKSLSSPSQAIDDAAQALRDHMNQAPRIKGRTWISHFGRSEFNSREPNTGLKVFDVAASKSQGFITGNVFSSIQTSSFVRAHDNLHCNGHTFEPGALRAADLKLFNTRFRDIVSGGTLPASIQKAIDDRPSQAFILYKVFHTKNTGMREVHGWVLTDAATHALVAKVDANEGGWNARFSPWTTAIMRQATDAFTSALMPQTEVPLLHIHAGQLVYAHPVVIQRAHEQQQQQQDAARQTQGQQGQPASEPAASDEPDTPAPGMRMRGGG